ncbi:hypothetical protein GIB67_028716 [Kingdonia uniflora]|uniref:Pentatricopeptide repeat-containing protein n=1 Tax=Kingdonia uniflora TaxID=39325 RepID=A0A7J7NAJ1_9MAGN|nr:hypothetical protein GIB67_028716 [Kingdonia uniflora]
MPGRKIASWNTMISGYGKSGDVGSATILFSQMTSRDFIMRTTMIACYLQNKRLKEAIGVFKEMIETPGVSPDEVTMSSVLSACAHLGSLEMGSKIHNYLKQNRFDINVYIGSALVDMYAKCGSVTRSLLVFFKLREKNLFCWNSIIEGLAVHRYGEQALDMFKKMENEKIKPNGVTFISVLGVCTHAGLVEVARKWFLSMTHDYNISPVIEHYGCMVDILSRAGQLEEALELIRRMTIEPNSVIWGASLGGCKLHGNLEIVQVSMEKLMNLEPDNNEYYVLLGNMYAEADRWSEVKKVR